MVKKVLVLVLVMVKKVLVMVMVKNVLVKKSESPTITAELPSDYMLALITLNAPRTDARSLCGCHIHASLHVSRASPS